MNNEELIKRYVDINKQEEAFKQLKEGKPIQYIIGNVDFCGNILNVDERVLIPRFETEYLVSKTINYAKERFNKRLNILDLGTGSGCIAITLKKELDSNVTACDISDDALNLAQENAHKLNADIIFINHDITKSIEGNYDIIISNPPYISENDFVEDIVKDNEPALALFAPGDGLYFYKKILSYAFDILNKNGFIAFEIGDNQKELLESFLKENGINNYSFEKDFANTFRYLFIFNE